MLAFLLISFCASFVGAICGVGGGVIIKPVLDSCGLASVSAISFLSGCTVLSMSGYSVLKNMFSGNHSVDIKICTPLAVGGAVGGILGKQIFSLILSVCGSQNIVGAVQSACLTVVTAATLLYSLMKARIHTHQLRRPGQCLTVGFTLGIISSFLGIGGGPINLVALSFFFSMETKAAAQSSLYIILFSQMASLLTTLLTNSVPRFDGGALILMIAGGISGGILGRSIDRRITERAVDILFLCLTAAIVVISFCNTIKYMA